MSETSEGILRESGWSSRYRAAMFASPYGWMDSVGHLGARARLSSLRRNILAAEGWKAFLACVFQTGMDACCPAKSHAHEHVRQMSHCSFLSTDGASILGYKHDSAGRFASWQWEAQVPSDNGLCQGSSGSLYPRLFSWVILRPQHAPLTLADATRVSAGHIGRDCPSTSIVISDTWFSRRASAALPL